jgi:hypothetical protein
MTPDQLLAFLLFAVVAAVTPGPSNIILTSTGAAVGVIRGLPCLFGASLGMGSIVFAAGAGLGSLVLGNAVLLTAVKWLGIAFLLWLSWQIATSRREDAAHGAPVGECLQPRLRDPNRVGVVPMPTVRAPPEPRLEQLHTREDRGGAEPIQPTLGARSFKTNPARTTRVSRHGIESTREESTSP